MLINSNKKYIGISNILILISTVLNIFLYTLMPDQMRIKITTMDTMYKLIVLLIAPVLGFIIMKITKTNEFYLVGLCNILCQISLFISNLVLIYINLA